MSRASETVKVDMMRMIMSFMAGERVEESIFGRKKMKKVRMRRKGEVNVDLIKTRGVGNWKLDSF